MRKTFITAVLSFVIILSPIHNVFAQQESDETPDYLDLVFSEPISYNFFINNEQTDYSLGRPYINRDMIVMIPLRAAVERMGYKVVWNGKIRTVIVYDDNSMFILKINRNRYYSRYNSSAILSKEPVIRDSRTFVPLEFFSTLMRVDVKIDSDGNLLMWH